MAIGGCLGQSDYEVPGFIIFGNGRKAATKTATLDMGRIDCMILRELLSKIPVETASEDVGAISTGHFLSRSLKSTAVGNSKMLEVMQAGQKVGMANLESSCRASAEKESIWPLEGRLSDTRGLQRCCLPL